MEGPQSLTFPPYFHLLNWQEQDFSKGEGKKPKITVLGENQNNYYLSHYDTATFRKYKREKNELFNTENSL